MRGKDSFFLKEFFLLLIVIQCPDRLEGKQYNLTRSSEYAQLGMPYVWTCDMFVPENGTFSSIIFKRNTAPCGQIGVIGDQCKTFALDPKYVFECQLDNKHRFTLTIPAENMTEYEQSSVWQCQYIDNSVSSPLETLTIAIDVNNVSLIPSDNPLTLSEGTEQEIGCVFNDNAFPIPTITWYPGSTDIPSLSVKNASFITITGDKMDNGKVLQCRVTNNNKPPKSATTRLNIQYKPEVSSSTTNPYKVIEEHTATLVCILTAANPNTGISWKWIKTNSPKAPLHNGTYYTISNIQREESGSYSCTATNSVGPSEAVTIYVDVQYPPTVATLMQQNVTEGTNLSIPCNASPGNPNSTSVLWTKVGSTTFRQEGKILQLPNINRNSSGTYRCTAENTYYDGNKGTDSQDMIVNVLYPPTVAPLIQQNVTEGTNLSIPCNASPGNPISMLVFWTMVDSTNFGQNRKILRLPNINRNSSGTYRCTAENTYYDGSKGTDSQDMIVNVLYKPEIKNQNRTIVNETDKVVLIREVDSNPLSNITWYDGNKYLKSETAVKKTNLTLENASCYDSKNFTLEAQYSLEIKVTVMVELIVNCKPRAVKQSITLGVTDDTGIKFSSTVIAYPEPKYELKYENGTRNIQMMSSLKRNFVNNFTIQFNQTDVRQTDYGTYHLQLNNSFGGTTVFVTVIAKRRPYTPKESNVTCKVTSAELHWKSSFDGGDPQIFTAHAFIGQEETSQSKPIADTGENKIHNTIVQNLQPSTMYIFYIHAKNKHGISSSKNTSCVTLAKEDQRSLPVIAVGAAAGGVALALIVIAAVFFLRRFKLHEKKVGKSQRLTNDECTTEDPDDGLKENILYVSAGPRNNNESEGAVYAAVTKKPLEDNANVYADVQKDGKKAKTEGDIYSDVKPKKGLFKKDGKQKPKTGKKQRGKQVTADVYENSEDIAMTSNADNVYSNTNYNAKNDQEQRGYKNKDGLLYVDVQFDAKKGKENPVIHGEDEKTDYATVEFPMPPLSQEDASAEKY